MRSNEAWYSIKLIRQDAVEGWEVAGPGEVISKAVKNNLSR